MVVVIDALLHSQTPAAGVKFYSENKTQSFCIKDQIPEPALFSEIRELQTHSWESSTNVPYSLN